MDEGITQVIWNGFVILAAVLTTLGAIIVTLVNCFRKGWEVLTPQRLRSAGGRGRCPKSLYSNDLRRFGISFLFSFILAGFY